MRRGFVILGLISLVVLVSGIVSVADHLYLGNMKYTTGIGNMMRLQIFGSTGLAAYDDEKPVHTIGDKYTFSVKGKPYNHQVEVPNPPQTSNFNVQYLPENPDMQSINPSAQLAMYKQQLQDKKAVPILSWVLIAIGLAGTLNMFARFN